MSIVPWEDYGQHIPLFCVDCGKKVGTTKNIDYIGARTLFVRDCCNDKLRAESEPKWWPYAKCAYELRDIAWKAAEQKAKQDICGEKHLFDKVTEYPGRRFTNIKTLQAWIAALAAEYVLIDNN